MTETLSIEDEIRETLKGLEEPKDEIIEAVEEPIDDLEEVVEKDTTEVEETPDEAQEVEEVTTEEVEPPPQGLSAKMKEKWKDLDPEVRQELARREEDFHKKLTASDSEYHFGKKMKDVVSPYMATILAEGGTPESAVKDLLKTSYVLRTANQHQKVEMFRNIAHKFGVDLSQVVQPQEQVPPALAEMQRELAMLRQQANPEVIKQQLQEQMESDSITSQVNAFAGDPANKYFEQVKPIMASLLSSGAAQDIQEAYDRACYADPTIRSTLLAEQNKAQDAKRKAEVQRKKQASASVVGSPDGTSPNAKAPNKSLEDELREAMNASSGLI